MQPIQLDPNMKKLSLLVLLAAMTVGAQAQSEDQVVNVGVAIGNALELTKEADLFFGTIATADVLDTLSVNAQTGAMAKTGAGTTPTPTDHNRGEIAVVGANDAQVTISTDVSTVTLTRDGGAETHEVLLGVSTGGAPQTGTALTNGFNANLSGTGTLTIYVGGDLNLNSTVGGFYRGDVTVTASYF